MVKVAIWSWSEQLCVMNFPETPRVGEFVTVTDVRHHDRFSCYEVVAVGWGLDDDGNAQREIWIGAGVGLEDYICTPIYREQERLRELVRRDNDFHTPEYKCKV